MKYCVQANMQNNSGHNINTIYSLFNARSIHLYNSLHDEYLKAERDQIIRAIGRNIKRIRRQKKLTQEKISELAGINSKYLGEIERGIKNPTALVVKRLATALGVPVCEILSNEGCPLKEIRSAKDNDE